MKKLYIACLAILLFVIAGCSNDKDIPTNTPNPTQIPSEETSIPMEGIQATPSTTPEETTSPMDVTITETSISGKFVEDTDNSATTIIFSEDGTFTANVNVCSGLIDIEGTYLKEGDSVSLVIPNETGVYYLDNDQPFFFEVNEKTLTDKFNSGFSCADVGKYTAE